MWLFHRRYTVAREIRVDPRSAPVDDASTRASQPPTVSESAPRRTRGPRAEKRLPGPLGAPSSTASSSPPAHGVSFAGVGRESLAGAPESRGGGGFGGRPRLQRGRELSPQLERQRPILRLLHRRRAHDPLDGAGVNTQPREVLEGVLAHVRDDAIARALDLVERWWMKYTDARPQVDPTSPQRPLRSYFLHSPDRAFAGRSPLDYLHASMVIVRTLAGLQGLEVMRKLDGTQRIAHSHHLSHLQSSFRSKGCRSR